MTYDVFFSYAWATNAGSPMLRDWSRKVADDIAGLLGVEFNAGQAVKEYLDRDAARTGQDLDVALKAAVEQSSILVVMVSDFYNSTYCLKEIGWFAEKVRAAGRSIADHVCILRVQQSQTQWWPEPLRGTDGNPRLFIDMCDDNGPFDLLASSMGLPRARLIDPIQKAVVEIKEKLIALRRIRDDMKAFGFEQSVPDQPAIFFEAEEADFTSWSSYGAQLRCELPSIVYPGAGPTDATIASQDDFRWMEGLVMLHARGGDRIGERLRSAYFKRRTLMRELNQPNLRWVLLHDTDEPPPESEQVRIPHVRKRDGWVDDVKRALWQ